MIIILSTRKLQESASHGNKSLAPSNSAHWRV